MPQISVIMGMYEETNHEQVITAIDSVLMQTYSDFEFIICDDGSSKEEYMWLKKISQKDKRISLIHHEKNQGLAIALNDCLKIAKGNYIARMDADDISKLDRFSKEMEFLEKNKEYAFVGSNVNLIDESGIWGERKVKEYPQKEDFLFSSPFVHPSIMVRSSIFRELNGYSTKPYTLRTEDYELFMRLYEKGYRGANLQESLLDYRENSVSYTKRKYKYRINEMKVRYYGFKANEILKGNIRYVLKPLLVGLIPAKVMQWNKKRRFGKK